MTPHAYAQDILATVSHQIPEGSREEACPDCGFYVNSFRPSCARCSSTGTVLVRIPGYERRRRESSPSDRTDRKGAEQGRAA